MNKKVENPNTDTTGPSESLKFLTEDRTLAILAHILGLFTGFIGALVIWLIKKDQSEFVAKHALEALNFQISMLIYFTVAGFLMVILIGFLLIPLLMLAVLIFSIQGAVSASNGKEYVYPFTIRIIK
jgi:uncharacterized Tic20 family protein